MTDQSDSKNNGHLDLIETGGEIQSFSDQNSLYVILNTANIAWNRCNTSVNEYLNEFCALKL